MFYLSVGRPEIPSCFVSSWTPLLYPASASALMSLFRHEELPLQRVKSWCMHIPHAAACKTTALHHTDISICQAQ